MTESNGPGWRAPRGVALPQMRAARTQLHWALSALCGVGKALVPHAEDDSEQSFAWSARDGALVQSIGVLRVGLALGAARAVVLDESGRELSGRPLAGVTVQDLLSWIETAVTLEGRRLVTETLPFPTGLADHPLAHGASFRADDRDACEEVARYMHNAARALEVVRAREPHASPVRCWPHHFDIATLIAHGDASINVGVSMGDPGIDEPYAYVVPWPVREDAAPGPLPHGGTWHREGWFGAVLRAPGLTSESATEEFLRNAVESARTVLRPSEGATNV